MRLRHRTYCGVRTLERVVLTVVVDGILGRPNVPENLKVLVCPPVTGIVVQIVAVAPLFLVIAPGDRVYGEPPPRELVERGQLAGGDRGRHKTGAVSQQNAQVLRVRKNVRRHDEPIRH